MTENDKSEKPQLNGGDQNRLQTDWNNIRNGERIELGLVQVDIAGHSKIIVSERDLKAARDILRKEMERIAFTYGGKLFHWAGDGGSFMFLTGDGEGFNTLVNATLEMQRGMSDVNKIINNQTDLKTPLHVRLSCDSGTVAFDHIPSQITAEFINLFIKHERIISIADDICITERIWKQIHSQLRERFGQHKYVPEIQSHIYRLRGDEEQTHPNLVNPEIERGELLSLKSSRFGENNERLKRYLFATYIALLVASAAGGSKIMTLGIGQLKAAVTVIAFAPTFLLTDCINQLYGREEARKFVWPGFWALLLSTVFMRLFVELPPDINYMHQKEYRLILEPPFRIFCAGLAAYLVSQTLNVIVFDKIKQKVGYKGRLINSISSTLFSQFIDTLIFVPGAFLWAEKWDDSRYTFADLKWIFIGQFTVKTLAALLFTYPVFMYLTKQSRKINLSPSG